MKDLSEKIEKALSKVIDTVTINVTLQDGEYIIDAKMPDHGYNHNDLLRYMDSELDYEMETKFAKKNIKYQLKCSIDNN
jgi:hypothetical protein